MSKRLNFMQQLDGDLLLLKLLMGLISCLCKHEIPDEGQPLGAAVVVIVFFHNLVSALNTLLQSVYFYPG